MQQHAGQRALNGAAVIAFHQQCLAGEGWPKSGQGPDGQRLDQPPPADAGNEVQLWHWVGNNHRFNSLLWDEEDLARRTQVSAEEIAGNKRAIALTISIKSLKNKILHIFTANAFRKPQKCYNPVVVLQQIDGCNIDANSGF